MYWRLVECITTEKSQAIREEEVMVNALIAAIAANEMEAVEDLLSQGISPASISPFFGEALSTAVSSGSMALVQMLLDHWDWERFNHLGGVRIMHAIEAAAAAGRDDMMTKLLEHQRHIAPATYDEAIVGMVRKNDWKHATLLLDRKQGERFRLWCNLVRSIAAYDRQDFLQHTIAKILPNIDEDVLGQAVMDACLNNHSKMVHALLSYFTTCTPMHHTDSLFWAGRCGSVEALSHVLDFLKRDQSAILVGDRAFPRSIFLALAGAVSGKKPSMVQHLLSLMGITILGQDLPLRFTDIVRLITPDAFIIPGYSSADMTPESTQFSELLSACTGGRLVDVVKLFNTMRAQHPDTDEGDYSYVLNWAIVHNHLDVVVFLTENLTSHTDDRLIKSTAMIEVFDDMGCVDRKSSRFR
jgi:hypothetical protein